MPTAARPVKVPGVHSLKVCYTQASLAADSPSFSCPSLIEDFEMSYVRTNIDDRPIEEPPRRPIFELRPVHQEMVEAREESDEDEDMTDDGESEAEEPIPDADEGRLRIKIKFSNADRLTFAAGPSKVPPKARSNAADTTSWQDEEDSTKKWYFDGKGYSKMVNGKETFFCQLCEDDSNFHSCIKRREMERHLRRLDHMPPELFCKAATASCPCAKNRAFTRIDGRKRHIKISIESARRVAQARRDLEEVERLNQHMKLLETSRGR